MTRKGQCTGSLLTLKPEDTLRRIKTAAETVAIYCAKAGVSITLRNDQLRLQDEYLALAKDETLMVVEGEGEILVTGGPDARLILSRMRYG